jgi:SAM-dependent methyltransferase
MKIRSASDVKELLGAYVSSAVLGSALELGLFWRLAEEPMTAREIAGAFDIPLPRCRYWLEILRDLDLLQIEGEVYLPSEVASNAILSTASQDAWHNTATESRDSYPYLVDLPVYIHEPGSALEARGIEPKYYFLKMKDDADRARRFTRMLFDFHRSLATNLAEALDVSGVERLMDLGGGSGIMANAILTRNPDMSATIVDIETVCDAGRKIVDTLPTADRIDHHPADILADDLPEGFDLILECDVNLYQKDLFRKLRSCLNSGGRLVIVDHFAPEKGAVPPGRPLAWGFLWSLAIPEFSFLTAAEVKEALEQTGFRIRSETQLPDHWLMIDSVSPSS